MRIGIDLGGTKIEALAIDDAGIELVRHRVPTPRGDYAGTLQAMADLVHRIEHETGHTGTVGAGIPGTISNATGLVKNANSTWLNGMPLREDLSTLLGREARIANDANCLAVSEATDGAAAGKAVVFGVILGTGCGGGLAVDGRLIAGASGIAGEWGHAPLPWPDPDETPGPKCWCGLSGCLETWISGSGLARDHLAVSGQALTGEEIIAAARAGEDAAKASLTRYVSRLGRGLAMICNILDPDVFVLGGGLSNVNELYEALPAAIGPFVFSDGWLGRLAPAKWGDSSGVRGAARLWERE